MHPERVKVLRSQISICFYTYNESKDSRRTWGSQFSLKGKTDQHGYRLFVDKQRLKGSSVFQGLEGRENTIPPSSFCSHPMQLLPLAKVMESIHRAGARPLQTLGCLLFHSYLQLQSSPGWMKAVFHTRGRQGRDWSCPRQGEGSGREGSAR